MCLRFPLAPAGCQWCPRCVRSLPASAAPMSPPVALRLRDLWDRPVLVPTTFAVLARCPGRASCSGHRPSKLRFLCPSLSCDTLVTVIGHKLVERTGCCLRDACKHGSVLKLGVSKRAQDTQARSPGSLEPVQGGGRGRGEKSCPLRRKVTLKQILLFKFLKNKTARDGTSVPLASALRYHSSQSSPCRNIPEFSIVLAWRPLPLG